MITGAIDCDIHPGVPDIKALLPYMNEFWRESFVARGIDGFDMMSYPLNAPITCRPDWRARGPRLRAPVGVPAQAPLLAAEEIERCASDHRFVQVLLPVACEMMLGRSYYWPIWEAAARHGLPIGIHAGSMHRYAPTSTGWPTHHLHDYVA